MFMYYFTMPKNAFINAKDGAMQFLRRGPGPATPDGFTKRDSHSFVPNTPQCKYRKNVPHQVRSCGCEVMALTCDNEKSDRYKQNINEAHCLFCPLAEAK
jgi:hypothetical protein